MITRYFFSTWLFLSKICIKISQRTHHQNQNDQKMKHWGLKSLKHHTLWSKVLSASVHCVKFSCTDWEKAWKLFALVSALWIKWKLKSSLIPGLKFSLTKQVIIFSFLILCGKIKEGGYTSESNIKKKKGKEKVVRLEDRANPDCTLTNFTPKKERKKESYEWCTGLGLMHCALRHI